uniref:Uncharacterized protein n=1 Tax=Rhizophora mucronata TaxID=61149 RepID=A0A2P2ND52_RHIMU
MFFELHHLSMNFTSMSYCFIALLFFAVSSLFSFLIGQWHEVLV